MAAAHSATQSVQNFVHFLLHDAWNVYADRRTLPYVPSGPWNLLLIVSIYLAFVLHFGPKFMKHRPPYQLNALIQYYNLINIILSAAYCLTGFYVTRLTYDCWGSEDKPVHIYLTLLGGLGYMYLKIFDLLDTIFFILRKKYNQVTFLHVSHHAVMPFTAWFASKYAPAITTGLTPILNSFVHVIMYFYYFQSAKNSHKFNWMKKYITIMQLVQFFVIFLHGVQLLMYNSAQGAKLIGLLELCESVFFSYNFVLFYTKNYVICKPNYSKID